MFEQYSYKIKTKALAVVFVMLCIAGYRRSFGPLLQVIGEHQELSAQLSVADDNTMSADRLARQIATLDQQIGKEGAGKEIVQQQMLDFVSQNGRSISVDNLRAIHEHLADDYRIYTYQMDLVGNFFNLATLSYAFEKQFENSKIVSLKFYTSQKNNQAETLHLNIIFQNYENAK